MTETRKVDDFFASYTEHHLNPVNKSIHWICVPLIMFSLLGLAWIAPFPAMLSIHGYINWASILMAFAVYYWYTLSPSLAYAMILIIAVFCYLISFINLSLYGHAWIAYLTIFILAWAGQFIGHNIEGKKPSFLKDLTFLLIGPLWLMHFIFMRLKIKY